MNDVRVIQARIFLRDFPPDPELIALQGPALFRVASQAIAACQLVDSYIRDQSPVSSATRRAVAAQMRARLQVLGVRARRELTAQAVDDLLEAVAELVSEMEERS